MLVEGKLGLLINKNNNKQIKSSWYGWDTHPRMRDAHTLWAVRRLPIAKNILPPCHWKCRHILFLLVCATDGGV